MNLQQLSLGQNGLTGPIPAELGNLVNLQQRLYLSENGLTGSIPAELGNLVNLRSLSVGWNPLTGSLPRSLTGLSQLTWLSIAATAACAPTDAEFQAWLATIVFRGYTCNRAPEPVGAIPSQTLTESGPAVGVSMETYFSDPDDDPLTYSAASSHAGTVNAFVSSDTVWLAPGSAGTATVTVTAEDPDGLMAAQTIDVTTIASAGPQNDREVLEVFYDSTGGASWTNRTRWKTSSPLGEWYGVTTNPAGRVTELTLGGNALTGPIPDAMGSLANLERLELWSNDLTGPVPASLGNLTHLQVLNLSFNALTGPIPREVGSLRNLERLELWSNDLTGPVPASLGNLTHLQVLNLSFNALTGPIPREVGSLRNLVVLDLEWNGLTGPVPASLGNLTHLRVLDLSFNALTGPIPREVGSLRNLVRLYLRSNDLTGPVSGVLDGLANLEQLSLTYNWGLSGSLPPVERFPNLERADFLVTQVCAPAGWRDRAATIELSGRPCETGSDVTIDVAVFHTPAAREAAGGAAAITAVVDLMVAETNQAYVASGVGHRLRLVERSEVAYRETGNSFVDVGRLAASIRRAYGRGACRSRPGRGRPCAPDRR